MPDSSAVIAGPRSLRIAVLIKQVPRGEDVQLAADGRLIRDGIPLEMNPFCRRAVSKAVELARDTGGTAHVFTLGPDAAEDVLREAVAWGADEGIHVTDVAFAGSDTLATARALAAALQQPGSWDLVLVGRNSVDADTGQVGPAIAQLLDLPFAGAVRQLELDGETANVLCHTDDISRSMRVRLPAVLAVAERLCDPAKVPEAGRAAVEQGKLRQLSAADLGDGPWGQAGSPTRVTGVREIAVPRAGVRLDGTPAEQARATLAMLGARGAFRAAAGHAAAPEAARSPGNGRRIAVLDEGDRPDEMRGLLTLAGSIAAHIDGRVAALVPGPPDPIYLRTLSTWGADECVALEGVVVAEDAAAAFTSWAQRHHPWAVFSSSTGWGREVAARSAAALGAGLTGDAISVEILDGRLVAWKPSFAARFDAAVVADSDCQMVTLRPGAVPAGGLREPLDIPITSETVSPRGRVQVLSEHREDDLAVLASADRVIGVGLGVEPTEYELLRPLQSILEAELAATRKVTDRGWLPPSRQIGITGRMIAPSLYIAVGIGGSPNHLAGVRRAGTIVAINSNPEAAVFESADIGIVGDWRQVVPALVDELRADTTTLASLAAR
jgi:electron transfer flavoprotein alpha subunit